MIDGIPVPMSCQLLQSWCAEMVAVQTNEVLKEVFCQNTMVTLSCPENMYLNILYSQYGRSTLYQEGTLTSIPLM